MDMVRELIAINDTSSVPSRKVPSLAIGEGVQRSEMVILKHLKQNGV